MTNAIESIASRAATALATNQNVPSPCISVCRMDATRTWCEGCLRTLDEIATWGGLGDDAKRAVWVLIEQRKSSTAISSKT